ncbi:hypothetical protein FDECE_191 [Fusarium decemcellulare]|nr:hypothetical protein FDECE_191 [Fusarium decemcellulare]
MSDFGAESPADASTSTVAAKRRPIPRKGHTKSRAGCVTCKTRKVKCDEVFPQCGPCQRLGLGCKYQNKTAAVARPLRTAPAMFDANDLNFFRHFLFDAYPPLPIDGFTVWQQASQLSHEYDFLLHSMLGLGASHLGLLSPSGYERAALKHRVTAIKSLNNQLSKPKLSKQDAEAAFGAMLVLTFQSAYMTDGLVDFLTMVRGCWLVGNNSVQDLETTIFKTFARATYLEKVKELVQLDETDQWLDALVAEEFCASIKRIGPLCKSVPELRYLAHMQRIATLALTDPTESYNELSFLYDGLGDLTTTEFASFIDPQNYASQLVIIHMLILGFVMGRKSVDQCGQTELGKKGTDCRKVMSKMWIEQMLKRLPAEYHEYAEWPMRFIRTFNYSFESNGEVWKPFSLSSGKVTWSETDTSSLIEMDHDTDNAQARP